MADNRFTGTIDTPHGPLDLSGRARVMAVLNVTPDSFSDGGRFSDTDTAVHRAIRLLDQQADILDIGGESTRPGARDVPPDEQIRRVVPVIERVRAGRPDAILSIDTRSAAVARAALDAGADIINDVSALRADPEMVALAAERPVPVVLMHMRGTPQTMVHEAVYDDVVREVVGFFVRRVDEVTRAGIERSRIILDPGIGFAKNTFHNLAVLNRLGELHELGLPVLVGPSRKRFIGHVLGLDATDERLYGTLAAVAACVLAGVQIVRVHDVEPAMQTVRLLDAIRQAETWR